jgi:uncharacterized membrane protein
MTRLVLGVLIWILVHFFPGLAPAARKSIISRIGEYPYKGIFLLFMIVSIYLIITGWSSMTPVEPDKLPEIYAAPEWGGYAAGVLVLIGFALFFAPYPPNNIRRMLRHPQLIGVASWGIGHLLAVGTARSLVFFGGLTAWAIIEIFLINRREGAWTKPAPASHRNDVAMLLFAVLVYLAFLFTHHLLFGGTNLVSASQPG